MIPDPGTHRIYFDRGTEGLDAGYGGYQEAVDKVMAEVGYDKVRAAAEGPGAAGAWWQWKGRRRRRL